MSWDSMPSGLCNFDPRKLAAALEKRLYPHTGLHRKQLCAAIGISRNTLDAWLAGNGFPRPDKLWPLIDLLDPAFLAEISGGKFAKMPDNRIAEKLATIQQLTREVTDAIGNAAP